MSQTQTEAEIFTLKYPFTTAAGNSIAQLTLNRLTVKDLKQIKKTHKNPTDWDEPLISRSTGLLPEDLDNMDLADYLELQDRFQKITGLGKKHGSDDKGAGAAGEVVPVPAGGD
ncbi:phage tail assembly protein [Salmonella enterica]|nr:phage tail assembly protein [Salmonella enterica]